MKVAILAIPAADLDAATITIEGTSRTIRSQLGVMRNAEILGNAGGATFSYYLDAPYDIQAATTDGTTAATMIVIDNSDRPEIKNMAAATIASFTKGKSYLLTNETPAVTSIIPTCRAIVAKLSSGNDSAVHCASHYLYVAMEDSKPLNATSVAGFTFDTDLEAVKYNAEQKQLRKETEARSYASTNNH